MLFYLQRLQESDLFQVINKMKPVPFARFRRTSKAMFDYVNANVHRLGVMTDFAPINLKDTDIHSGYSFDTISYHDYDLESIYSEEFFATRKCRPIYLEVLEEEMPEERLEKFSPRELIWRINRIPKPPKTVHCLEIVLKEDIYDWSHFKMLETCSILRENHDEIIPRQSVSSLLEFWKRGSLENLRRFQTYLTDIKNIREIEGNDVFFESAAKHLPDYVVRQLKFLDIEVDEEEEEIFKMASTTMKREDGRMAQITIYERQWPYPDSQEEIVSNTICQIYFNIEEGSIKLLPFQPIQTTMYDIY